VGKSYILECWAAKTRCLTSSCAADLAFQALEGYCREHPGHVYQFVDGQTNQPITKDEVVKRLESEPEPKVVLQALGTHLGMPVFGDVVHITETERFVRDRDKGMKSLGKILNSIFAEKEKS